MAENKDIDVCEDEQSENQDETEETTENAEQEIIDADDEENQYPENNEEITALKEQNDDLQNRLLRLQAEFDNFKKRTTTEKNDAQKYKAEDFAIEMLPIVDNFERALQTEITDENKGFYDGVKMVYNQMLEVFEKQGIEPVQTVDYEFDPNMHHAVMQTEEEDKPSNTVVEELQKGYMLKDKVIRPAMVKVNK